MFGCLSESKSVNVCILVFQISIDIENAKCGICLNIWHDVISVAPCLHNFWSVWNLISSWSIVWYLGINWPVLVHCSNGCFSEWLRRSQERHATVLCPQCRAVVQFAGKNHFLREVVEVILCLSILICQIAIFFAPFFLLKLCPLE